MFVRLLFKACEAGKRTKSATRRRRSGEQTPALAMAFYVAETAPALGAEAEIEFLYIGIVTQRFGSTVEDDSPAFEEVTMAGVAQCWYFVPPAEWSRPRPG